MSDFKTISIEKQGEVAIVRLNRPDNLNAIDSVLRRELLPAVRQVNSDDEVRVVVLTGAGRAFSAGADLSEMPTTQGGEIYVEDELNHEYKPALMEIYNASKPWISAINGPCAGIGSAFGMVCDLTVMAEDAYIYQAFAAISLVPDGGATWHLARALGRKRAYEVIVTGEKISAQKCLDWGLCNRVAGTDTLVEETVAWAKEIAGKAPLSLRYAKEAVNNAMLDSVGNTISDEARLQHICINSDDAKEGVMAFMEKRPAAWKGR